MLKQYVTRSSSTSPGIIMASDRWIFPCGTVKTFAQMDADRRKPCSHNYYRLDGHALGCVTYRCSICGDEYEKDIS